MIKQFYEKIKESLISVIPITALVLLISLIGFAPLSSKEIIVFIISSIMLIVGIALFNLGAEISMTPMGKYVGQGLTESGKLIVVILVVFLLGTFITVAEPDLQILAGEVGAIVGGKIVLLFTVGISVGLFIVFAVLKIVLKRNLNFYLLFFYMLMFAVSVAVAINNKELLPLAFDSGGVTTGPITVPFIMALGVGIANSLGGKGQKDNSFGFVALCSVGAVIGVLILGVFARGNIAYESGISSIEGSVVKIFISRIPQSLKDVSLSLGLLVAFFLIVEVIFIKLPLIKLFRIFIGIVYTFLGLVIFLTAVNAGLMPIGYKLGLMLAEKSKLILTVIGFLVGFLVVMAEPAVRILNGQVEEITNGTVSKKSMLIGLAIGVGLALALSVIRIIYGFSLTYYLIPFYAVSFLLSFYVPPLYTAIAFDSGGVASGPLTSGFILPFAIGACTFISGESSVISNAYGIVAMVAVTPLITVQLLGFKAIVKTKVERRLALKQLLEKDDEHIIEF